VVALRVLLRVVALLLLVLLLHTCDHGRICGRIILQLMKR